MQAWCTGPLPRSWLEAGRKPIDICVSPGATGSERRRHTHRVTMKQTAGNVKWRCTALLSVEATATLIALLSYESSQGHWPTVSHKSTSHNDLAQMTTDQTIQLDRSFMRLRLITRDNLQCKHYFRRLCVSIFDRFIPKRCIYLRTGTLLLWHCFQTPDKRLTIGSMHLGAIDEFLDVKWQNQLIKMVVQKHFSLLSAACLHFNNSNCCDEGTLWYIDYDNRAVECLILTFISFKGAFLW